MASNSYAMISNGVVRNIAEWDGVSAWEPEYEVVEIPEGMVVGIGWLYLDGEWQDPNAETD